MAGLVEIVRTAAELAQILPALLGKAEPADDSPDSIGTQVEATARLYPQRPMILFEGRTMRWAEFDANANAFAHALKARGVGKGAAVALLMENRIEFLVAIVALARLGAPASLLNTNLRGRQLAHCIRLVHCSHYIVGEELADAFGEVREELGTPAGAAVLFVPDRGFAVAPPWATDLNGNLSTHPQTAPDEMLQVRPRDTAFYVFTSGTTGLPKATVVTHRRYLRVAREMARFGFRARPRDRMYVCLPLYHGTGLIPGVGACLASGASIVLRRKFSASQFLAEVRATGANLMIYVGELCRYLVNQPEAPDDADNPLERLVGNGLQPGIWRQFKRRFGIRRICEFYGAGESPSGFANLLNKDETVGMTGHKVALVEYNGETGAIRRDAQGRAIRVAPGTPGLLLMSIADLGRYEGYTDRNAVDAKMVRDVFENGDLWMNSGDLLRQADVGFTFGIPHFQFVDRMGDTFRWKSENVSTVEVAEILNGLPGVKLSAVYGVEIPGAGGRAGMAALVMEKQELGAAEWAALSGGIEAALPAFARPVFLRFTQELATTGTHKFVKEDLRKDGYDVERIRDPIFVLRPGASGYMPLDRQFLETIRAGRANY